MPYRHIVAAAALALLPLAPGTASPQEAAGTPDFSHLTLSLGGGVSSYASPFDRFWSPAPPLHASLASPLFGGRLRTGVYVERGRSVSGDEWPPGFRAVAPYVEWGPAGGVGSVEWALGVGGGGWAVFLDRELNAWEIEATVGASAEVDVGLGGGWRAAVRGLARRVLTAEPLDQPILTLELRKRFRAGPSLRRALVGEERAGSELVRNEPGPETADPAAPLPDPVTGRRTVRGEDLPTLGVAHLSDLVARLPDWSATTVNLRTWWASPKGLSSYDDPGWDVWVDGVPVHLDVMGLTALDRLGVAVSSVDSVVVVSAPGLHDGRFADRGRIHVHTRTPARGWTVRGEAHSVQPTGEPGPLEHTAFGGTNVDRLATGVAVAVEGAAGPVSASADLVSTGAFYTDHGASERIFAVRDPTERYPRVGTHAGRISVGLEAGGGRHRLLLGRSQRSDLPHVPDLALETPTRSEHLVAGLSGSLPAAGETTLSYHASWAENRLEPEPGEVDFAPDLTVRHGEAGVRASGGRGTWGWSAGAGASLRDERFGTAGDASSTTLRAAGSLTWRGGSADGRSPLGSLEIEPALVDGEPALAAALRGAAPVGPATVAGALSWSARRAAEEEGLWSLWTRGFGLPEERGLEPRAAFGDPDDVDGADASPPARRTFGADLEARLPLGPLALRLFGDARAFRGVLLARPMFRVGEDGVPEPEPPTPVVAGRGEVAGLGAELSAVARRDRARLHAHYRWRGAVSGDEAFREAWERVPEHVAAASAEVRGPAATAFHGRVEAWSATRWSRFGSGAGDGGAGPAPLAGGSAVEVGARKAFLGGDVLVGAWVRDLLDRDARRHPLGSSPGLSVGVHGSITVSR